MLRKILRKEFSEIFIRCFFHFFHSRNNSFSVIQFSFSSAFPLWIVVDAFSLPASEKSSLEAGRNFISALAAENQPIRLSNETKRNLKEQKFKRNWMRLGLNKLNAARQSGSYEGETNRKDKSIELKRFQRLFFTLRSVRFSIVLSLPRKFNQSRIETPLITT